MRLIVALLKRSRGSFAIALVACVLNGIASVLLVATLSRALSQPGAADMSLALRFALCAVTALVTRVITGVLFARLSQDTMAQLRGHVARRVAEAELRDVERIGAAPVQSVLTDDATNVSMLFFALPNLVMHGSIVFGCLGYLAWLSWPVCLVAVAAILVGSLGYHAGDKRAIASLEAAGRSQDKLFGYLGALFTGAKELKLHQARSRQFVDGQLGSAIDEVRDHRRRAFSAYAVGVGWIVFLFYVFLGVATFWPALGIDAGAPSASGYVVVFLFMLLPLDGLLNNVPTLNAARVSLDRIEKLMGEFSALRTAPPPDENASHAPYRTLTFRNVTHSYFHERDERMFRVGPVDLTFTPGELVFIVGGNGSGKTTLAKVLTGLYEPEDGTIELDGKPIGLAERAAYRQRFTAVFNDFHLFDALLGIVDPNDASRAQADARANALVAKLALDHKVQVLNGAFSTRALSTGQRKRLALVVAYLEDRPLYLFDEWAADQDPQFKAVFYEQLLPELRSRGKTVLVISHDDRYFHLADRVLKLDNGSIVSETYGSAQAVQDVRAANGTLG
ncbi:cyclic peptide export ABC transporter [Paraburkholderia rhynchosiae]|nr:cyclic peptide export ABC transporter [Paraburkholderia rhynchosiae]CAB3726554.1 ABC transporter ATP-binding/permease protein YojI [Paraburkholderia rhynchosiae]